MMREDSYKIVNTESLGGGGGLMHLCTYLSCTRPLLLIYIMFNIQTVF